MDLNSYFIEECNKCKFPIRGITIKELITRTFSGETFIYFASNEQKSKIVQQLYSPRWVHFGNEPRIYIVEGEFDEDLNRYDFYEGWMLGDSEFEIEKSMDYYANISQADHGYFIVDNDYELMNISELI